MCYLFFLSISLFLHTLSPGSTGQSHLLAVFEVDSGKYERENTIVGVSLAPYDIKGYEDFLILMEVTGEVERVVDSQLDFTGGKTLWWVMNGITEAGSKRRYELYKGKSGDQPSPTVKAIKSNGQLKVQVHGSNVLQYNYDIVPPPEGIPKIYERGGFIHPLWSPKGEVLTRIQPPDHYHHVGIWNPWTHTEFEGREIDFWNLAKGQGTVRFNSFLSTTEGSLFGGFRALHDHIEFFATSPKDSQIVLKEEWEVRVWNTDETNGQGKLIDFISTMNCATDSLLRIKEYRYQGFGYRATEKWNDQNSNLLTSEGFDKSTGNGTRARWCNVNGISDFGHSGILFMTHPNNYNFPEPIRIWPTGLNGGESNVFFNFNPTMDRDWLIEPGKDYKLRYRMYVYDGFLDAELAEKIWNDFSSPPVVTEIK